MTATERFPVSRRPRRVSRFLELPNQLSALPLSISFALSLSLSSSPSPLPPPLLSFPPSVPLARSHPPRPRLSSRLTASNPDVTAPFAVSLEHAYGQCSLFVYIRAFHRVGGLALRVRVPSLLVNARWRNPSFFRSLSQSRLSSSPGRRRLPPMRAAGNGNCSFSRARRTGRTAAATTTAIRRTTLGRYAAGSTPATPGVATLIPAPRTPTPDAVRADARAS